MTYGTVEFLFCRNQFIGRSHIEKRLETGYVNVHPMFIFLFRWSLLLLLVKFNRLDYA